MTATTPLAFRRGDLICFRFPQREGAAYPRPCLILEAKDDEVLIAYGTTSMTGANRGHEIAVRQDHASCGLDRPTRFVGARRIRVSVDDPRIERCPDGGPTVIGRLPTGLMARLEQIRAEIEAASPDQEARLAAERAGIHPCRRRRESFLGRRRTPVVVEVRISKLRKEGLTGAVSCR